MKTLRHVEINDAVFYLKNNKKWISEESCKLENLRILKQVIIKIGGDDNVDVLLRRCPNLQELEIGILCDEDSVEICQLESLTQLQILRLSIDSFQLNVSKLHLSSNLKKLVLWGARIEDIVSSIGGLPSLEYLQLVLPTFIQLKEWCLGDVTFHKLKSLKLEYLSISRWDVSEESFPLLERLVIKKCYKLKEIPLGFADIQTLKQIKLVQCKNKSLEASALKIKEEAEAIGGSNVIDLIVKDKGLEDAKQVIAALKDKSISAIGARVTQVPRISIRHAVNPAEHSRVGEVKAQIAILGAEIDHLTPPELVMQFKEILSSKPEVDSFVKIYPGVAHGWTVRYNMKDKKAVQSAEEAHQNMLNWFAKHVKWVERSVAVEKFAVKNV